MNKPCKGSFAFCGLDSLGLIVSDELVDTTYLDGNKGRAWIGIHLTDKIAHIGDPWSSRSPRVVGHVDGFK